MALIIELNGCAFRVDRIDAIVKDDNGSKDNPYTISVVYGACSATFQFNDEEARNSALNDMIDIWQFNIRA